MARVIVTGGGGQLAGEFARLATTGTDELFVATHAELDITSAESVSSYLDSHPADVVVNCAAYTAVDKAESEPTAAYRVNAEGVAVLAREVAKRDMVLIHISTDYVFSGTARVPYTEGDTPAPQCVYGETKWQGEREMLDSGCRGIIIRTGWLYSSIGHNFVRTIAEKAQRGDTLRVVADQWGTPTYAADLAAAVMKIIPQILERRLNGEVFHYSNYGETSWWEFADTIASMIESASVVEPIATADWPTPARRPEYSVLDKTKIKAWFGVDVPDWELSLSRCLHEMGLIKD
ncbi:MAG: dTDP-4-dehydrorhamnose reductase [Rikenellaceae bacterium]|nr:dTDP-4-dehydrorhamnose reductase [Rikenellaceae bacterium]